MIGFIVNEAEKNEIENEIKKSFAAIGLPFFWSPGFYRVEEGADKGNYFMPYDSQIKGVNLAMGKTVLDFSITTSAISKIKTAQKDFDVANIRPKG